MVLFNLGLDRDVTLMFSLEGLVREQPTPFSARTTSMYENLKRKLSAAKQEQEEADQQLELDSSATISLFQSKLVSDQANYRVYLESLQDADAAARQRTVAAKQKQQHAASMAAASLVDNHVRLVALEANDDIGFAAERTKFAKHALDSAGSEDLVQIGVVDLGNTESMDQDLKRMAGMLRTAPERSCVLVLLPWDPNRCISSEIQMVNKAASALKCICDASLTLSFDPESRSKRDSRRLDRWGAHCMFWVCFGIHIMCSLSHYVIFPFLGIIRIPHGGSEAERVLQLSSGAGWHDSESQVLA